MANRRKVRLNQFTRIKPMAKGVPNVYTYTYEVMSLTNTLTPRINTVLTEPEMKMLMRKHDLDVTIRADKLIH